MYGYIYNLSSLVGSETSLWPGLSVGTCRDSFIFSCYYRGTYCLKRFQPLFSVENIDCWLCFFERFLRKKWRNENWEYMYLYCLKNIYCKWNFPMSPPVVGRLVVRSVCHDFLRGGVKKKWYFWVVPTTKWPIDPPTSCGQSTTFFVRIFFCLESPDTEK